MSPSKPTDVRIVAAELFFLPVETRMPLKFGAETLRHVTCVRVRIEVTDAQGRAAVGWGETPLSVQWVWPSALPYAERQAVLLEICRRLAKSWTEYDGGGHPIELAVDFQRDVVTPLCQEINAGRAAEPVPYLAALVAESAFDLALHDAYGNLHGCDVYRTYGAEFVSRDLSHFLQPAPKSNVDFRHCYLDDFLVASPPTELVAWHLVGGLDPLNPRDLKGDEPDDGYPVLLRDWIETDGLQGLKVKLCGNDAEWDYDRLLQVGNIAAETNVPWLSADFNCTVTDPEYVNAVLDRLRDEQAGIYGRILYVEQPFPYDLEQYPIDVRSVAARKPLFLDESAHDWRFIQLGRSLGWSGVALKTCKTQTGALLSLAWAKAHGMPLMVQDLTNPMLAQIPHVRLAAHAGTIMGVETNGMQFYPEASRPEAAVHPGLYRRRNGRVDLSTLQGTGFGYRVADIDRELPEPAAAFGR